jgi:GAF domain-containing protein
VEVLEMVCLEVERIAPEVTASILEVDAQGLLHPLAGPSLPHSYSALLDGVAIGPNVGSCGTAAWRNAPVLVDDIAHDPLWADFKHLILPLGFRACWSTPICNSGGKPIGTFAFYYREQLTGCLGFSPATGGCLHPSVRPGAGARAVARAFVSWPSTTA